MDAVTFGSFSEDFLNFREGLTLVFSPSRKSLEERWRNFGLSATFLADYFANFCSTDSDRAEVRDSVSFIANELLENSMKFSDKTIDEPVTLQMQLHHDHLIFLNSNSANEESVHKLQSFIQRLAASDPEELYFHQIESDDEHESGGLGFLSMIVTYAAKIGWKFEVLRESPRSITVTVMVQLPLTSL